MGKKRKASSRNAQPTGPKELDAADARLGPITTYKDVADSEEEYFINRDKIMFDEEPRSKRARRVAEEDKFLEQSDEEILDEDMDSEDEDEDEDEEEEAPPPKKGAAAKDRRLRAAAGGSDDEAGEQAKSHDDDEQGDSDRGDAADARLGPITTYKDVADSEEEYFINRDKIMFDEEPRSKRARRVAEEDKFLEQSDEEILDEDMDSEDEDEKEEAPRPKKGAAAKDRRRRAAAAGSDDEAGEQGNTNDDDGEQGDSGWWGDAKTDYYDNDQIETEADALEEEAEAKRLQQKKLAKMAEEDFLFDEGDWLAARPDGDANDGDEDVVTETDYYDNDQIETEADALEEEAEAKRLQQKKLAKMAEEDFLFDEGDWLAAKPDGDGDGDDGDEDVVTEVLQDVAVTDDMTPEARSTLLAARYPEFEYLVREFRELQPRLVTLQKAAHGKSGKSLEAVRYWILGCYVAALASYFAILTSPARDGASTTTFKILAPAELRDHEVMETLVTCREAWQKLDAVRAITAADESMDVDSAGEEDDTLASIPAGADFVRPSKADKKIRKAKEKAQKEKAKRAQAVEDSFADLDGLLATTTTSKKARKSAAAKRGAGAADEDGNSDFGEEEELDARTAADKAARKKSLRFYTSQIVQKANRRAGAGRDAGGDADIPYRERLRDRQARLNAEAEKRGQKGSKYGEDLGADPGGDESNDEDAATAKAVRAEEDDEYYDMVAARSGAKKADKAARQAALAAAGVADRVVEQEVIGPDGKRSINYTIEKNKGLAPKRKKENRNPRVKKKLQYEAKQKKLRSMMSTYKGGEPQGGYGGEKTGITTGLVRARKL
ncbi:hypothetical protein BN1723_001610 [Verticillium longisporum]|uniref:Sas10 C-terminal domain-containing protein n=1 Tax=Verticillium longisporum TaxID=100787 RepID=A0A0G4KKN8_VERLO|nr:hypothetical protein BN1723_001610 [Verticillium longisporum]